MSEAILQTTRKGGTREKVQKGKYGQHIVRWSIITIELEGL